MNQTLRYRLSLVFDYWLLYGTTLLLMCQFPLTKSGLLPFRSNILNPESFSGLLKTHSISGFIFDFLIITSLFILFFKKKSDEKDRATITLEAIRKVFKNFLINPSNPTPLEEIEKVSLRLLLVKIIFVPLMLSFAIGNLNRTLGLYSRGLLPINPYSTFLRIMPFILSIFLLVDTAYFVFGYLFESKKLGNIVRSVEPTFFGWLVTLLCYPPLNNTTQKILGWYSKDFSNFGNIKVNLLAGAVGIIFMFVYVWATLALGTKSSNLTNRGIVHSGPYRFVRHPAYIAKNVAWWLMGIPFILNGLNHLARLSLLNPPSYNLSIIFTSILPILSLASWSLIYYLRAITEERHLGKDPDYQEYIKKVPYRFIPKVL